jgi:RNA polymerase sigma factor (sigma-70 family)
MRESRHPNEDEQERQLHDVVRIARGYARNIVNDGVVDDLAQQVAFECLVKMRDGSWVAPEQMPRLVRSMTKHRAMDWIKHRLREESRDTLYCQRTSARYPEWMSASRAADEAELKEFHAKVMAKLPGLCRKAFIMVREERATYEAVAERLGISTSAVHRSVVQAQKAFREALPELGITPPPRGEDFGHGELR